MKKISFTYFISNINFIAKTYIELLAHHIYSYIGILILTICIIYKMSNVKKYFSFLTRIDFLIFLSCLIWGAIIIFLSPYKDIRYIIAITPLLITTSFFIIPKNIYLYTILSICIFSTNIYGIPFTKSNYKNIFDKNILIIYNDSWKLHTIAPYLKNQHSKITIYHNRNIQHDIKNDFSKFDAVFIDDAIKQSPTNVNEDKFLKSEKINSYWTRYEWNK